MSVRMARHTRLVADPNKAERRRLWQPVETGIRSVLLEWNPIGAATPDDEYDCLIWPVVRRLESGADDPELAAWLREEMAVHFGLDSPSGTDEAAERLRAAWDSAQR